MATGALPSKVCARCGRRFAWRRKWARDWEAVRFCSQRCRATRDGGEGERLEQAILALLAQRAAGATICPSEAARALGEDDWRARMEPSRAAARRLAAQGLVEVLQRGQRVDPDTARGPIRLRRRSPSR